MALFPEETTPRSGECGAARPSTNRSGERRRDAGAFYWLTGKQRAEMEKLTIATSLCGHQLTFALDQINYSSAGVADLRRGCSCSR